MRARNPRTLLAILVATAAVAGCGTPAQPSAARPLAPNAGGYDDFSRSLQSVPHLMDRVSASLAAPASSFFSAAGFGSGNGIPPTEATLARSWFQQLDAEFGTLGRMLGAAGMSASWLSNTEYAEAQRVLAAGLNGDGSALNAADTAVFASGAAAFAKYLVFAYHPEIGLALGVGPSTLQPVSLADLCEPLLSRSDSLNSNPGSVRFAPGTVNYDGPADQDGSLQPSGTVRPISQSELNARISRSPQAQARAATLGADVELCTQRAERCYRRMNGLSLTSVPDQDSCDSPAD